MLAQTLTAVPAGGVAEQINALMGPLILSLFSAIVIALKKWLDERAACRAAAADKSDAAKARFEAGTSRRIASSAVEGVERATSDLAVEILAMLERRAASAAGYGPAVQDLAADMAHTIARRTTGAIRAVAEDAGVGAELDNIVVEKGFSSTKKPESEIKP